MSLEQYNRYMGAALRGGCDAVQAHEIAFERLYREGNTVSLASLLKDRGVEVSSATSMKGKHE